MEIHLTFPFAPGFTVCTEGWVTEGVTHRQSLSLCWPMYRSPSEAVTSVGDSC